jgi:hypothetical protein
VPDENPWKVYDYEVEMYLATLGLIASGVLGQSRIKNALLESLCLHVRILVAILTRLSALWKDADPDIPILKQVKVEYAKLE